MQKKKMSTRVRQRFCQKFQVLETGNLANCGIFYSCFNLSVWICQIYMRPKLRLWQVFWWSGLTLYCENIYRNFQKVLTGHTLTLFHPGFFVPCSTGPMVFAKLEKLEHSIFSLWQICSIWRPLHKMWLLKTWCDVTMTSSILSEHYIGSYKISLITQYLLHLEH